MAKGGGAEQSVLGLIRGLDRERFEPYLILRRRVADEHDLTGVRVLSPRCRDQKERWWREWRFAFEVFREVRRLRIDIVHSHSGTSPVDRLALLAAGLAGAAVIRTMRHTPHVVKSRFGIMRKLFDHYTSYWTVVSPDIIEHLHASTAFPRERIISTPNGIDFEAQRVLRDARADVRAALGATDAAFVILAVGRLAATKDHATLIRAVHAVKDSCPHVRLFIAGGGDKAPLRRVIMELGVEREVTLLGYRDDVSRLLAAADGFVSASLNEGLPRAVLEAMGGGIPVAATDIAGTHHVLDGGNAGILVAPKDPEAMGEAIASLVNNADQRTRLGKVGQRRATTEFSEDAMVRRYEELYEGVVGGSVNHGRHGRHGKGLNRKEQR